MLMYCVEFIFLGGISALWREFSVGLFVIWVLLLSLYVSLFMLYFVLVVVLYCFCDGSGYNRSKTTLMEKQENLHLGACVKNY